MDRMFGLPAHPLVVHIPVAMLPLAAVGVVVMLLRRAWYERYRWAVLGIAAIGTVGAFVATASGEGLEEQMVGREGREVMREIHDHAEAGDLARGVAIVFFVVLALWVLVPWHLERRAAARATADPGAAVSPTGPTWLRPVLMVAVAIAALASVVTVINAGHSGASRAWEEYHSSGTAERD